MATIILGGIGAAIGSTIPGFGTYKGFQVGAAIGGLIGAAKGGDAGKISDLKFTGSSYGVVIPRFWGAAKIGANVIWTKTDANGNTLVQHSKSQSIGGGSGGLLGGGSGTSYWYSATFAFYLCVGTHTFLDGTQQARPVTVTRILADDVIVYDSTIGGHQLTLGSNLFVYSGTETQSVDPIISASMGTSAQAYRGIAYCVLQDMDLSKFGNRIPSFQVEVSNGPLYLSDVAADIFRTAGLSSSDYDVSLVTSIPVTGILEESQEDLATLLGYLLAAYTVDLTEVDGVLRLIPRGGSVTKTLSLADLGATSQDVPSDIVGYQTTRVQKVDLYGRMDITHFDPTTDFQQATQSDIRQGSNILNINTITLPMAMSPAAARSIAAQQLDFAWTEVQSFQFTLPMSYIDVAPCDVIDLPYQFGSGNIRTRVIQCDLAPIGEIQVVCVPDAAGNSSQSPSAGSGPPAGGASTVVVPTTWVQWSGFEVRDADQNYPGIYVAAAGSASGWQGCDLYYSLDGTNYVLANSIGGASVFGSTTSALSDSGAVVSTFDNTNTFGIDVTASLGAVTSVSDAEIASANNCALVGGEIIGIGTSSLTSAYHYTLSHLKRGLRTEGIPVHASGERFIMLGPNLARINFIDSQVGITVYIKCVSPGQDITAVTAQTTVLLARTLTALEIKINSMVKPTLLATPVTLADSTVPSLTFGAWTTLDLSAHLPSQAQFAILQFWFDDSTGSTTWLKAQIRANSSGTAYTFAGAQSGAGSDTTAAILNADLCPVDTTNRHLDYYIDSTTSARIDLLGYWS